MRKLIVAAVAAVGLLAGALPADAAVPTHTSVRVDPVGPGSCWQNPGGGSAYVMFVDRYREVDGPASRVRLTVRRDTTRVEWLQADGSWSTLLWTFFGDPAALPGAMGGGWSRVIDQPVAGFGPGVRETTWRWDPLAAIPDGGTYTIAATVDDAAGTRAPWTGRVVTKVGAATPC